MVKKCPICGGQKTIKKGLSHGKKRWYCKRCQTYFTHVNHKSSRLTNKIRYLYYEKMLSMQDIADLCGVSRMTIYRHIKEIQGQQISKEDSVMVQYGIVLQMDATYWGQHFGVIVARDHHSGRILWHKYIYTHEKVEDYVEGICALASKGYPIIGVVGDGIRGVPQAVNYPYQFCQFHARKRFLDRLSLCPESEAKEEMKSIIKTLCTTDKESFVGRLNEWHEKWDEWLNETISNMRKKKRYKQRELRNLWLELQRVMSILWTYYDRPELSMPNTNNDIEALFSGLKRKMISHAGIQVEQRIKLIDAYLAKPHPKRKIVNKNINVKNAVLGTQNVT